ncbi:uncharacterized protein LOC126797987 [Argentina anserina]|uniref:uncharacterized protein LOC126797987 n=1 Tax=Argentina anserina TaxID=57926 RepID=UPI0021764EB9|nr:uncharacterized protein LOC126797987 [Potentilla anserina]
MDGGEGWPMVSCAGGAQEKSVLTQIMLRFRPIAPKPVASGSGSGEQPAGESKVRGLRGINKRKYVRVRKDKENGKEREERKRVVTLQLLPEIEKSSDGGNHLTELGSSCREIDSTIEENYSQWLSLSKIGRENNMGADDSAVDQTAVVERMGRVESWVTVECVTGTCRKVQPPQGFGIISTDEERMRSLEVDSCPGFISDSWNKVRWLNGPFRRMVAMTWQVPEVAVWLAMNEELPGTHSAFTCQVKLSFTAGNNEKEKYCSYSQMVPCDLWRMDGGGFAWRLDVRAALTLAVDSTPLYIKEER